MSQIPEDPTSLYRTAREAIEAGDYTAAETALLALLAMPAARAPGRFLPDLDSFLAQLAHGRHQDWNLNWQGTAAMLLAMLYWNQERHDEALSRLQSLLAGSPSAEGYHLLARWLLEIERREPAVLALNQALQQDPAYLPAYEDLAMIANLNGDSDLAAGVIQQAMAYELSPRLFDELLLACSREDYLPMRSLFLELCVRRVGPETRPLLVPLLRRLYAEGDLHHAGYLGYHLLQAFPGERELLSLYVLAMLNQRQYAPALKALLQAPDALFRQGEHWLKLGIAYSLWRMPDFARFALQRAAALSPELEAEIAPWRADGPQSGLDALLSQILRQMLLQPSFAERLRTNPKTTLASWGLEVGPGLLEAVALLPAPEQEHAAFKPEDAHAIMGEPVSESDHSRLTEP